MQVRQRRWNRSRRRPAPPPGALPAQAGEAGGTAVGRHVTAGGWSGPPPREVCIVMLSALGDAVHVLPLATALKRAWPATRITWLVQPAARALVGNHPAFDDYIVFHRRTGLAGLAGFAEFAGRIRERRFDLLLGLQVYLKAGVLSALTPAAVKLGFDRRRARDLQWLFTTHRIPPHAP
ncbi:MAG: glycosyltransferase family 9 protein, partial [Gemmatimonadetes bacterium]|nr:glycosyltransferase family 9 protein [Gemmatimonadota bacterium]